MPLFFNFYPESSRKCFITGKVYSGLNTSSQSFREISGSMVCQSTSESNFSNPGGLSICSFFSLLSAAIVVVCVGSSSSEFLLFSKWRCSRSISRFSSFSLKLWRLFKLHRPHVINFFSEMPKIFFLSSFSFTCFVKHLPILTNTSRCPWQEAFLFSTWTNPESHN